MRSFSAKSPPLSFCFNYAVCSPLTDTQSRYKRMPLHLLYCVGLTTGQLVPKRRGANALVKKSASIINYPSAGTAHSREMRWCIFKNVKQIEPKVLSLNIYVGSVTHLLYLFMHLGEDYWKSAISRSISFREPDLEAAVLMIRRQWQPVDSYIKFSV